MDGMPWFVWLIGGLVLWAMISGPKHRAYGVKSNGGCGPRRRSHSRHRSERADEVARLKAELDASMAQIDTLKARLAALETIVTDEDRALRQEFRKLGEA